VPASPFLRTNLLQSAGLGAGLFFALGLVGLLISRQHFGHIAERETAAAEIGRARKFLDSVVKNIPDAVTVRDIDSQEYLLANRSAGGSLRRRTDDIVGKAPTTCLHRRSQTRCAHATSRSWICRFGGRL